jgi:phenylalanyl-tRNA synthetase beta chain
VKRDFAFVVDSTVEAAAIVRAVNSAEKKLIAGAQVFDIFTGASLGEGKKSVAVEVVLQPLDRTLTEEDLEATAKRIVEAVTKQTGGTLRG